MINELECEVTWNNLSLYTKKGKPILKNTSGQIGPKTLTAIIGPSGSGKTTLLDTISGRILSELKLVGEIKINGYNRNIETWPKIVSYVGQFFPAYEKQTVCETLTFVASIKLRNSGLAQLKVEELMSLLGLEESRDTLVKNLSGGERIRVSLGIEMLGNPPVLLLDEPVSGLDSFNALNILETARKIADIGKTVLITIHQPSYKMTQYFDKIIIMCEGSSIFDGPMQDCIKFFENCGFKLPENTNPTDFFLDVLAMDTKNEAAKRESMERIGKIRRGWNEIKVEPKISMVQPIRWTEERSSKFVFQKLYIRGITSYIRNTSYIFGRIFQRVFIGLIFSLTFLQLGVEGTNAFSFRGVIILYIQNELFGTSSPILNVFNEEKKIIDRERKSGLYTGYEAYWAKFAVEFSYALVFTVPYAISTYYIVGLITNFGTFVIFLLILLSVDIFAISFGLTIGAITSTTEASQIVGVSLNVFYLIYSGTVGNPRLIPSWLRWLCWLSPVYYAFSALCSNQINSLSSNSNSPKKSASESTGQFTIEGPQTFDSFGLNSLSITANVFVVLGYAFLYQIIGTIVLHYRTRNNLRESHRLCSDNGNAETI
ncbi:uncharacterized protein VICG_01163 [Vittaforma corneae ATCC 50505]|uniref:ABC transporter domain-containing protein n=1 Tax=Vittaforma corneae (strain ATCC 50505) TaxID=993615 RepID=L2GLT6_VITCO|nr:uncharacterized protein VICG_01163 [Vittaforma corneae ATCC 50505]ELA41811.1 hypothetical protein VICG_01163 [Vittaforma corneae ATCC 50505]